MTDDLARAFQRTVVDPGFVRLRAAGATVVVGLLSAVSAALIGGLSGESLDLVVLAVMLSLSYTQERAGATIRQRLLGAVALPVVAVAAGGVGALMVGLPVLAAVLFVLAMSGAIWVRRLGPTASRIGTLVALPFVTVLVAPLPVRPSAFFPLWTALVALVVVAWVVIVGVLAQRFGILPRAVVPAPSAAPRAAGKRDHEREHGRGPERAPGEPAPRRALVSTRMAVQMAAALLVAFAVGYLFFGEHWPWVVLTAYLVSSGNRGRGDVVHKGVHRVLGALGGTIAATLLALVARPGDAAIVVWIVIVLALALWLRPVGYGWWAAGVTAALSLLNDYSGVSSQDALLVRLVAIVVGGVIAVAAAWLIMPVRTGDVLRRRTAEALAALSAVIAAGRDEQELLEERGHDFEVAVARLEQLAPTLRAHRAIRLRDRGGVHRADVVELVSLCRDPARRYRRAVREHPGVVADGELRAESVALSRRLGALRRTLAGRADDTDVAARRVVVQEGLRDPGAADVSEAFVELLDLFGRLDEPIALLRRARR
ncbi:FUSC family protein [Compostimonas suwonensis]|uniref:Fusaric acid resistance family protein n=1 Tax=Compostimonas suwonensis TaxID=1048394 RepID=A0A2M9BZ78_9MICO|nr:FUSC family protein [Compostimonas suwonensis]PJJ63385.1 fusaric acid resistance family protein [Compostimonas suwonensis]